MSSIVVRASEDGAVVTVTFARPEKKNALTLAMYDAVVAAMRAARADERTRVLLFEGQPGVFTAGNDIGDFMQNPPGGEDSPVFRFLNELVEFPWPVVAAVDGPAVGVGTTMLLHCDVVLASSRARFILPFVSLGLVPEAASSVLLPAVVGRARAQQWLLTGEPVSASEALAAGLVGGVCAPEELGARAAAVCATLASKPPEALKQSKALLREPMRAQVREALSREGAAFVERLQAPETMAAFMAFMSGKK